jgi:hypothetical protein
MRSIRWLMLVLTILSLAMLALGGCTPSEQEPGPVFDELARRVPGDTGQVFFLNLKPVGEAGRHWARMRQQLAANSEVQTVLDELYADFLVGDLRLDEWLTGPAVQTYHGRSLLVIAQVSDGQAVEDALLAGAPDVTWEQEEYQGRTLYTGPIPGGWAAGERLTWTVDDGTLYLIGRDYTSSPSQLQEMLDLPEEDSLAGLPAWQKLSRRLPEAPLGVIFFNPADSFLPANPSRADILGHQVEGITLAAVPQADGMRVEIAGSLLEGASNSAELRELFDLPGVDPSTWAGLPADTALALIGHDASILWPWLTELLSLNTAGLDSIRDTIGLDLEADLMCPEGPLTGDLALGITPPLAGQPIIEGLAAAQLLFLAPDATPAQADGLHSAMESRGAVFGPEQVEDVPLQVQLGTRPSGYAVAYGFYDDILFLGSSPEVIGRGIRAQRNGGGLVDTPAFQSVMAALPDEPALTLYLHPRLLTTIAEANLTAEEYPIGGEFVMLGAFEAIGLGLRPDADRIEGAAFFLIPE